MDYTGRSDYASVPPDGQEILPHPVSSNISALTGFCSVVNRNTSVKMPRTSVRQGIHVAWTWRMNLLSPPAIKFIACRSAPQSRYLVV